MNPLFSYLARNSRYGPTTVARVASANLRRVRSFGVAAFIAAALAAASSTAAFTAVNRSFTFCRCLSFMFRGSGAPSVPIASIAAPHAADTYALDRSAAISSER